MSKSSTQEQTHPVSDMSKIVSILEKFSTEYSKTELSQDNLRDRAIYFARRLFKGLSLFDSTMDKQFDRFSYEDFVVIEKILTFSFSVFNLSENFEFDVCETLTEKSSLNSKAIQSKKRKKNEVDDITSSLDNLEIVEVIETCDYEYTKGNNKGKLCGTKLGKSSTGKCAKHSK